MLTRHLIAVALFSGLLAAPIAATTAHAETAGDDAPEREPEPRFELDVSLDAPRPIVPPPAPLVTHAMPEGRPRTRLRWYGHHILASDLAALVAASAEPGFGGFVYVTGGPLVHLLHGNYGEAAGSAGMRLGLPLAGVQLGLLVSAEEGFGELDYAIRGAMLGTVAAVAIDSAIAFKRVPVEGTRRAVTPVVRADSEGAMVGLGGAF